MIPPVLVPSRPWKNNKKEEEGTTRAKEQKELSGDRNVDRYIISWILIENGYKPITSLK